MQGSVARPAGAEEACSRRGGALSTEEEQTAAEKLAVAGTACQVRSHTQGRPGPYQGP